MALYLPTQRALFIHIYRTGGTTMRACITQPDAVEIGDLHALPHHALDELRREGKPMPHTLTVVRHPYTWLASTWCYVAGRPLHREYAHAVKGMGDYIRWIADVGLHERRALLESRHARQSQFAVCSIQEWIFRHEDYPEPVYAVCERLGLPRPTDVPRLKPSSKSGGALPEPDAETKKLIQRVWARDFERFGYDG